MFKDTVTPPVIKPQSIPFYPQQPQKDRQKMGNPANANHLMKLFADVMKSIITENSNFVTENQLDCQNETDFKDQREQFVARNRNNQVVVITNKASIEKSKFGEKYRQSLDPRDQMLSHPFQFILQISAPANGSSSFMNTQAYQTLCQNIEQYIVDVVENVVSVSFNFLNEGKLKQNESKDFISKNILLNVYSVFKESLKTLTSEGIIYKRENKKLRFALIQLVENCLNQVLLNLSSYYPQTPPTGSTSRMREALLSIDRNQNQQLDFLYTQNLKITREEGGDYTEFIMKVINRAIQVTSQIEPNDPLQQTLYQKFVAFSQHLFWVTQEDTYNGVIQRMGKNATLDENNNKSMKSQSEMSLVNKMAQQDQQLQNRQVPESPGFFSFFGKGTEPNKQDSIKPSIKVKTTNRAHEKKQVAGTRNQKQLISAFMRKPIFAEYANAQLIEEKNKQKKIEEMKKRHDFAMGQKIPGSVKPFSKKDLMDKNFSAKHSAVLRMLTKWAENLQNIFQNPEAYTTNRIYPFKTLNHEIIYPKKELKDILFKQITEKIPQKQKIKDYLIARNKVFQSAFFAKDNNKDLLKFIRRYTETRVMASKMNALLIQFMKQYVSQLINLLVDAGKIKAALQQGKFTIQRQYQINLVVFKIDDLMQSKIYCSETTCIRLLKTLYIIEQTNTLKNQNPVFELVKIENKLDSRDNNILINYLFMGKIQCQLQISVSRMLGKEINYYNFANFLYKLTKGKLGVLTELASIISEHDPILSTSSDLYYEPKKWTKKIKVPKKVSKQQKPSSQLIQMLDQRMPQRQTMREEQVDSNKMFICKKCDILKFQVNMDLLKRELNEQSICNLCLIADLNSGNTQKQKYSAENTLKDDKIAEWLVSNLRRGTINKLTNYEDLSNRKRCIVFSINQKKRGLQFSLFNKQQSENILYIVHITKDLWQKEELKGQNIQYEDITSKINQAQKFAQFTYVLEFKKDQSCMNILKMIKFIKFEQVFNKLEAVDAKCQQKILKNSMLNILKNNKPCLQFNCNEQKMKIMNKFVDEYYNHSKIKWVGESLSHIKFVIAEYMNMKVLPYWLSMCQNTQLLNLSHNKIQDISALQGMTEIKELVLKSNRLKQSDMRKFIHLERLNVSDNGIKDFELMMLPQSILELDIGDNKLQKLNVQVMPPNLRKLDLFGNHLTTINLKQLPSSLQNLDLSYNKIEKIDEMKDSTLKVLLLSNNNLTAFKIYNMPNLRQFAISQNALNDFGIKNCPSLVQLHIGGTALTKLEIIDFPQLVELSIEQNIKIKSLKIKQLPSINIINMNSLILVAMDNLQIQNLNQDGVTIGGSKKLIQYLQLRFPNIQFYKETIGVSRRLIYLQQQFPNIQFCKKDKEDEKEQR